MGGTRHPHSLLLQVLQMLQVLQAGHAFIRGVPAECSNEGDLIHLSLIADDPCLTCVCKNKEVICRKEACNATLGCHMLLYDQKERCCDVCKGCSYQGREYRSGSEWHDPSDPCVLFTCQASVITVARVQCHVPCKNPLPPVKDVCCPSCQGCVFNEIRYREGDVVFPVVDPCVKCVCQGGGNMECSKQACPVLACPDGKAVLKPGSCCPECKGTRKVYDLKNKCLLGTKIFKSGQTFQHDQCTHCECQGSTTVCQRESCSPLLCPPSFRVTDQGVCCPSCRREEQHSRCMAAGKEYKDGANWKLDPCTTCGCQHGQVRCYVEQCRGTESDQCPPRHRLVKPAGECCGQCVQDDAVCTVFGDPHYRTFDGRIFNFQGSCKYVLAEDCHSKSFSIRVRNDNRASRSFSWTKTVFFKIGKTKVTLEQHMNVKVNRVQVQLPYEKPGLSITNEGYTLRVRTHLGVHVLWDGDSFLEIAVPSTYQNRLCGLCGNYNGREDDDFITKSGNVARDAVNFGASWRVGDFKQCSRPEAAPPREPLCQTQWDVRIRAVRECNAMKSPIFSACHRKVNPVRYFKSCLLDMCECPTGRRCYCEALTAYAHECSRSGVDLSWRNETQCNNRRRQSRKRGRVTTTKLPLLPLNTTTQQTTETTKFPKEQQP